MAFSDLQIKVATESAIQAFRPYSASLSWFAKNFSSEVAAPYQGIQVPVFALSAAADFDDDTNNWGGGQNEIDGVVVNLDKHFIKSLALTDIEAGATNVNFLRDGAVAIARKLGEATNSYVYGLINAVNVPVSADVTLSSKAAFAQLGKVAADNGIDATYSTLVLNPESFYGLLGHLDSCVYGGPEAIRDGIVPNLFGFKAVVRTPYLPEGTIGAIVPEDTLGIVSRVNAPVIDGYINTWTAEGEDGLTFGYRVYEDLAKGKALLGADCLFGAKILRAGIVRLV